MRRRRPPFLPFALVALAACATTGSDGYEDMLQAMETEVEPLVGTTLPTELERDPGQVDFAAIHAAANRVAAIFRAAQDPSSTVYINSAKDRKHAVTAATWFDEIAAAASASDKFRLVQLRLQKPKICSSCHKAR